MMKKTNRRFMRCTAFFCTLVLLLLMLPALPANAARIIYYGDADGDGKLTAADARTILRIAVKLETYDAAEVFRYNVDNDLEITASDARSVLRMSVNLESKRQYTSTYIANYRAALAEYFNFLQQNLVTTGTQVAALADIDANGIPELLIGPSANLDKALYTYSPNSGRMIEVMDMTGGKGYAMPIYYDASTHQVVYTQADTGGGSYNFYYISGSKMSLQTTYRRNNGKFNDFGQEEFFINGRQYGSAEYYASLDNRLQHFTQVSLSFTNVLTIIRNKLRKFS